MKGYTNKIEECDLQPGIYTKCQLYVMNRIPPLGDIYVRSVGEDTAEMKIGSNTKTYYTMPKSVVCCLINCRNGYGECKNI